MAETWSKAFGRYLRALRQRKDLSLQEVCSRSRAFAETLDKGYLSRCENGHQGPAFSKVIPLSRIYEVPAEVLLERLELDMELDKVGGCKTEGMSYTELAEAGKVAMEKGARWDSYALLRDSVTRAAVDEIRPIYRDRREQTFCAYMNCATAARSLGRRAFALFEFKAVESSGAFGPRLQVMLFSQLSVSYRSLKRMDRAREYGDLAISTAIETDDPTSLGIAYSGRGLLAYYSSEPERAASFYRKAFDCYRRAGSEQDCARILSNLAQLYFDLGRLRASRRAIVASEQIATRLGQDRARALGRILMGEIDLSEHKSERAIRRWREAAEIAKNLDDKELRFKAEYFLYRQAQTDGNQPVARSIGRRLTKLAHWIPEDTPELKDFRELQSQHDAH